MGSELILEPNMKQSLSEVGRVSGSGFARFPGSQALPCKVQGRGFLCAFWAFPMPDWCSSSGGVDPCLIHMSILF